MNPPEMRALGVWRSWRVVRRVGRGRVRVSIGVRRGERRSTLRGSSVRVAVGVAVSLPESFHPRRMIGFAAAPAVEAVDDAAPKPNFVVFVAVPPADEFLEFLHDASSMVWNAVLSERMSRGRASSAGGGV